MSHFIEQYLSQHDLDLFEWADSQGASSFTAQLSALEPGTEIVLVLRNREHNTVRLEGASPEGAGALVLVTAFGTEGLVAAFTQRPTGWVALDPQWGLDADIAPLSVSVAGADRVEGARALVYRIGDIFEADWAGDVSVGGLVYHDIMEWAAPSDLGRLAIVGWSAEDRAVTLEILSDRSLLPHKAQVGRWDGTVRFGLVDLETGADVEPGLTVRLVPVEA